MSISLEPNKGLRIKLGRFSAIRTWHGGGNFWSHEFQLTARSGALAGFLPRAIEDEDSVLFEFRSGGGEQAGTSAAISSMSEIPTKELKALRAALDELKKKAEDPHCDRTKRQMIEGFRLPDPQKDRDLYRLIGKGSSAKLIVLWGLEREEGSALAPGAAVDLMHTRRVDEESPAPASKPSSKLFPALAAIALLAAGGWFLWQKNLEKQRLADEARARAEQERIAAFNATASTLATVPAPGTAAPSSAVDEEPPPDEDALLQDDEGNITGLISPDGTITPAEPGTKLDKDGNAAAPPKPGEVLKDEKGVITGVVDKDGKIAPAAPGKSIEAKPGEPVKAEAGTIVRDSKGAVAGIVGKDGKVVEAKPGTAADKDGKVTTGKPGSVFRDEKGSITGVADKDGKVISSKAGSLTKTLAPGSVTRNSTGAATGVVGKDGKVASATPGKITEADPSKAVTGTPGSLVKDSKGSVAGVIGSDGKLIPAKPGTVVNPAGKVVRSTTVAGGGARWWTPGTVVRSSTGQLAGIMDKDGKIIRSSAGTTLDKNGKISTSPPGTVVRDHTGTVTGVVDKDGKVTAALPGRVVEGIAGSSVRAPAGTIVRDRSGMFAGIVGGDGKVISATPGTALDKDGNTTTGAPGTVYRGSDGSITGVAGADGKIVPAAPGAGAVSDDPFKSEASPPSAIAAPAAQPPPASITTPMTTQGPPPAGISALSIVSTSLSGTLPSGQVEVLLNVVARDNSGAVVNAPPITGWKVDGALQSKADGSPADGPVLPASLTPGSHRISTVGTGADGQPFQTDADVVVTPKQ